VVIRLWLAEPAGRGGRAGWCCWDRRTTATELAGAAAALDPGMCGSICQMAPGSGLLAELNRGDENPAGARGSSCIWTASTRPWSPRQRPRLDGATNIRVQDVCPSARLGHGDLITSPLALGLVVEAVGGRLPSTRGRRLRRPAAAGAVGR
jgi:hypothetical protein